MVTRDNAESARRDFRQDLTNQIVTLVEHGTAPWQKPWRPDDASAALALPANAVTGRAYRGGNAIGLMIKAQALGSSDPRWCTYRQAQEQGWQVRKGSKGTSVEYWQFEREETRVNPAGQAEKVRVKLDPPRVFYATVFHASQIDGIPVCTPKPRPDGWNPIAEAERVLTASGARLFHDQADRAFYAPAADEIHLPPREAFATPLDYYEVALHEIGHASGHSSRLNRDLSGSFGSAAYAREELRVQMASLFLSAELGVPFNPDRHAAYQASWVQVLQDDKHEIFRAARDAEQIADHVLAFAIAPEFDRTVEQGLSPTPAVQPEAMMADIPNPPTDGAIDISLEALRDPQRFAETLKQYVAKTGMSEDTARVALEDLRTLREQRADKAAIDQARAAFFNRAAQSSVPPSTDVSTVDVSPHARVAPQPVERPSAANDFGTPEQPARPLSTPPAQDAANEPSAGNPANEPHKPVAESLSEADLARVRRAREADRAEAEVTLRGAVVPLETPAPATQANVIEPADSPQPEQEPGATAAPRKAAVLASDGYDMPPAIASRYVVRDGAFWRFDGKHSAVQDGQPHFEDKGARLTSAGDDRDTVADMVAIAKAKHWDAISVKGSDDFKRHAWLEASLAGLEVKGFTPKEADLALLEAARREREALTITSGRGQPAPDPANAMQADTPSRSAPVTSTAAATPERTFTLTEVRATLDAALASYPENVRRELTARFNARAQAGVELQQQAARGDLAPAAVGAAIDSRFTELKTSWDEKRHGTSPATESPTQGTPTPSGQRQTM